MRLNLISNTKIDSDENSILLAYTPFFSLKSMYMYVYDIHVYKFLYVDTSVLIVLLVIHNQ